MRVYIESAGCSRRKLDIEKLTHYFVLNGYQLARTPRNADYILIVTCAFNADEQEAAFNAIEKYRGYRGAKVVYGCLPDISPRAYHERCSWDHLSPKDIDKVDLVFPGARCRFVDVADENIITLRTRHSSPAEALRKLLKGDPSQSRLERFMGYLRKGLSSRSRRFYYIETCRGCLGNCSYCGIRRAIGTVKSKSANRVLEEFRKGMSLGYRDFILLGDDVGAWGQDLGACLPDLMSQLLAQAGLDWGKETVNGTVGLHIEDINPRWIIQYRRELLPLLGHHAVKSMVCSLQSGNDRILGLMNRGNTTGPAIGALSELLAENPGLQLDTQVIVGFPSETNEEFNDTLAALGSTSLHSVTLFPYDEKENAPCASIQPKVSEADIRLRVSRARDYFHKRHIRTALSCATR